MKIVCPWAPYRVQVEVKGRLFTVDLSKNSSDRRTAYSRNPRFTNLLLRRAHQQTRDDAWALTRAAMQEQRPQPEKLAHVSLFTGIGGWEYALKLAGIPTRTVLYCETNEYRQEVIRQRIRDGIFDDAPIWPDVRALNGRPFAGKVDILTAGFPCQPYSTAGRRQGAGDERNLWPDTARVIGEVRPRYVLLENVPGLASSAEGREPYALTVLADLARMGYVGWWGIVGARDVGAPHRRDRWWCLAHSHDGEQHQRKGQAWQVNGGFTKRRPKLWTGRCGEQLAYAADAGLAEQEGQHQGVGRTEQPDGHGGAGLGYAAEPRLSDGWSRQVGEPRQELEPERSGRMGHPDAPRLEGWSSPFGGGTDLWPAWPPSPSERDRWEGILREHPELAPAVANTTNVKVRQTGITSRFGYASEAQAQPSVRRVADGVPDRRKRLEALGDALVPMVVVEFLRRVMAPAQHVLRHTEMPEAAHLVLDVTVTTRTRVRRDDDGVTIALAAARDGMADALGIDDSRMSWGTVTFRTGEPEETRIEVRTGG